MKQKFTFEIDNSKGSLTLSEAGEIDTGSFAKLHEETYSLEEMKDAMKEAIRTGQPAFFIEKMRRKNLFPPDDLAIKLFKFAKEMFQDEAAEKTVVEYEDTEAFPIDDDSLNYDEEEEDDDDDVEVTDMLKEDPDDVSEDDIKDINPADDTPKVMPDDDSEYEN